MRPSVSLTLPLLDTSKFFPSVCANTAISAHRHIRSLIFSHHSDTSYARRTCHTHSQLNTLGPKSRTTMHGRSRTSPCTSLGPWNPLMASTMVGPRSRFQVTAPWSCSWEGRCPADHATLAPACLPDVKYGGRRGCRSDSPVSVDFNTRLSPPAPGTPQNCVRASAKRARWELGPLLVTSAARSELLTLFGHVRIGALVFGCLVLQARYIALVYVCVGHEPCASANHHIGHDQHTADTCCGFALLREKTVGRWIVHEYSFRIVCTTTVATSTKSA